MMLWLIFMKPTINKTLTMMTKNHILGLCLLGLCLAGCQGRGHMPLITTPILYSDIDLNLFDYVPPHEQTPTVEVFYATNRQRHLLLDDEVRFGNRMDDRLHVGVSQVRLGDEDMTWERLNQASVTAERDKSIPVTLESVKSCGVLKNSLSGDLRPDEQWGDQAFAEAVNEALDHCERKKIKIYVHGFKVDFDHGVVLGGQFRHFAMREGVTIAFDWACRQTGWLYPGDVKRAQQSVPQLVALLDFLAENTQAESICIISWSAGAPIHSAALTTLRQRHPDWNHEQLFEHYRLDEMIFAASDIDNRTFMQAYKDFYDLPRSIIITICEDDAALAVARWFHGFSRLGAPDPEELTPYEMAELQQSFSAKAEIVDVTEDISWFDAITDPHHHRYWYDNCWISTDILMSIYLDLPADQRGLMQDPEHPRIWTFGNDYPSRVVKAWKDEIKRRFPANELPPEL